MRLGLKRNDNFAIPEDRKNDEEFKRKNAVKIDHPTDFFEFLRIGRSIASQNQK
ncbi:hypothetical protein D3C83_140280 [compost metagenome]